VLSAAPDDGGNAVWEPVGKGDGLMTRPPDLAEVVCPRCGTVYTTELRQTVDHEPESWSDESGSPAAPTCPECGATVGHEKALEPHVVGPHPSRRGI
jgi:uncharacterized C2H2 Zn-finger protein